MVSLYELHVADWKHCQRCDLAAYRRKVCLTRGSIPADVLFIGEAPGESEDLLGRPFIGPAGKLLDHIISRALTGYTYAITNLVGCIPREEEGGEHTQPSIEAIEECSPRLQQLLTIVNPRLIVAVGALARDYLDPKYQDYVLTDCNIPTIDIQHPAALLRMPVVTRGFNIQRSVIALQTALEDYLPKQ